MMKADINPRWLAFKKEQPDGNTFDFLVFITEAKHKFCGDETICDQDAFTAFIWEQVGGEQS